MGVDEVGRGPLFGHVVSAACIMPKNEYIMGIKDSKKMTEKQRNLMQRLIWSKALAIGFGAASPKEIDQYNILEATKLAMVRAINEAVKFQAPDIILIDAVQLELPYRVESIVGGDNKSYAIASASILAKVARDSLCYGWDKIYPGYGIAQHKGYGTKMHMEALHKLGATKAHRKTFIKL